MMANRSSSTLRRELGLAGAVMMGLGSILGTGVFVSIGIGAGVAGPAVILAIAIGAVVATCNGLSSAQLAANHPVSGGTYEYGYRLLSPSMGFTAGWMFLLAKSASAATAAIGFAGYIMHALGADQYWLRLGLALLAVIILTIIVLCGLRRSNLTNIIIVSVTLIALMVFIASGLPTAIRNAEANLSPFFRADEPGGSPFAGLLEASALMFVAYTGYGRIATLGEEVRHPRRIIPRAIIITLGTSMLLYIGVGLVGVGAGGVDGFGIAGATNAAPLERVAALFNVPGVAPLLALGAVTAMLGVLLNLILGLSRVALAMGRRGDLPSSFGRLDATGSTPVVATIAVGLVIASLVLVGNVKTTWSFSAFTVLIYYALTNLAALRLPREQRLFPIVVPIFGLASCLFLAFWVDPSIWLIGLGLLVAGLAWKLAFNRRMAVDQPS